MAIISRMILFYACVSFQLGFAQDPQFRWSVNEPFASFKGDEKQQSDLVDIVIKKTNSIDSFTLFIAADTAYKLKRFTDAVFLFHVARIRAFADSRFFPYTRGGGDSPGIYLAFLNENAGQVIQAWMSTNLDSFQGILDRLSGWDSDVIINYSPGWTPSKSADEKDKNLTRNQLRDQYLSGFRNMAKLFNIPEYKYHYMAINPFLPATWELNRTPEGKANLESHMKQLLEIENKLGIKGYASSQKP
ncbi:MAG: hypothetical protein LWW79_12350 [Holophagaceae bacterium]|nr:hypothetical protein [Holophagaceae bacterium]